MELLKRSTPSSLKKQIGTQLRMARRRRGMTQAELGRLLNTNQSHVSNVERGDRGLTLPQLLKICDALKVSPNDILAQPDNHDNGRPLDRRFLRRLEKIERLPKSKKQALLTTIDAYLGGGR
jgi:transcriptional regulator with XRE-family HTH domain